MRSVDCGLRCAAPEGNRHGRSAYRHEERRNPQPQLERSGLRFGLHHHSRLQERRASARPDGLNSRQSVSKLATDPESDFVFTNAAGGRIGWLQHGFRKALRRAGLAGPPLPRSAPYVRIAMDDGGRGTVRAEGHSGAQNHRDDAALRPPITGISALHGGSDGADLGEAREPASGDARNRESSKARSAPQPRHKECSGSQRIVRSPCSDAVCDC